MVKVVLYRNLLSNSKLSEDNPSYNFFTQIKFGLDKFDNINTVIAEDNPPKYIDADIGIYNFPPGIGKSNKTTVNNRTAVYQDMLRNSCRPLICESPTLSNYISVHYQASSTKYQPYFRRVGFDHWQPDLGNFYHKNSPNDRWEKMKNHYGFNIDYKSWRANGEHIVVCLSLPDDPTTRGVDQLEWLKRKFTNLRKHTDRKVVVRPHPNTWKCARIELYKQDTVPILKYVENNKNRGIVMSDSLMNERGGKLSNYQRRIARTLATDLENAWACVMQNGRSAIHCAFLGIPFYCTEGSFAFSQISGNANTDLHTIENPPTPDRYQWFCDMAYTEWEISEIREGLFWKHLQPYWKRKSR